MPEKEPRRLERQVGQTLPQMLADLPTRCSIGTKRNAKGHTTSWIGYKLHIDTARRRHPDLVHSDCPPRFTTARSRSPWRPSRPSSVTNLYDLMDSAYDAPEIRTKSIALGHVPIIDHKTRRGEKAAIETEARAKRFGQLRAGRGRALQPAQLGRALNANLKKYMFFFMERIANTGEFYRLNSICSHGLDI